ncbi:hypothetical protein ACIQGZ_00980 [Streptomyces sp. NPDC092296]|uniref:hypothetical protein n=1 Tax=Streptomyces sp. NPDC092296 TaxID=3366012 RepID=UPI00381DB9C0
MTAIPCPPHPAAARPPLLAGSRPSEHPQPPRPRHGGRAGRVPVTVLLGVCAGLAASALVAPPAAAATGCDGAGRRPAHAAAQAPAARTPVAQAPAARTPTPAPAARQRRPGARECRAPAGDPPGAPLPVAGVPGQALPAAPAPGAEAVPWPRHQPLRPPPVPPQDAGERIATGIGSGTPPFSAVAAGTYLPLGMGMSMIGFGVALVGLRLRRH